MFFRQSIANDFIRICNNDEESLYEVPTPEQKRRSFQQHQQQPEQLQQQTNDKTTTTTTTEKLPKLSITSLECPICFEDFNPATKIYQCTSGHLYCGECKPKLVSKTCPQCRQPLSEDGIRNIFLEKIIKRLHECEP